MTIVIVERAFETDTTPQELQAKEDAVQWCFSAQRVKFLRSYCALDQRHMICMYDAPDAEAVRTAQRSAGLPVEHAWPATVITDAAFERPRGYSLVVAQRALPKGITREHIEHLATDPNGCNKRFRLQHLAAFLSSDCSRMFCAYHSPDLESIRIANRESGAPIERLWTASTFGPPA